MAANLLAELVKIGECSTVDFETGTITATFPDRQDKVSRDIPVLFAGGFGTGNGMPKEGDTVLCLMLGNGKSNGVCLGVIPDASRGPLTSKAFILRTAVTSITTGLRKS
ncbi:hypothetical protein CM49_04342 [Paenibacillus sp. P1XP2]|nr:hypothetical protein CM49_04342 [Paenibacillus sp. P1XP2]